MGLRVAGIENRGTRARGCEATRPGSRVGAMSANKAVIQEVLPKAGLVVSEKGNLSEVLCKPKMMPLKSITLEKLEEMEKHLTELAAQQAAEGPGPGMTFGTQEMAYDPSLR